MAGHHKILFSGHMIDSPGRKSPRFPQAHENDVAAKIKQALINIRNGDKLSQFIGIAGCASGGDILFHEACQHLNIPSIIFLAESVPSFKRDSVSPAGEIWEQRFEHLVIKLPVRQVSAPDRNSGLNIWEQCNQLMLQEALSGAQTTSLIALWDGKSGDGKGGTKHMVDIFRQNHRPLYILTP